MPSTRTSARLSRSRRTTWLAVIVTAVGLVCGLAACSTSAPPITTVASSTPPIAAIVGQVCCAGPTGGPTVVNGIDTSHNGWDIAYINWMVPHDAVDSQFAELAPTRAGTSQVKELAATIDGPTQTRYLKFAAMANAWNTPVPSTDPSVTLGGHDHGGGSPGETAAQLAADLAKLSGAAFDKQFLTIIIADQKAAIPEANTEIANGANPQSKLVAQNIVTVQSTQITQMEQMEQGL